MDFNSTSLHSGNIYHNVDDCVCIHLNYGIKVMFNTKDSVLVRNYRNNVCMTMAGVDELSKNQLFTMQRIGIKVHQTAVGSLNVEIIKTILPYNNMYAASMYYDHGKYHTLEKLTNSEHTMFKILTCEEVFHYKRTDITMEMKNIAAMLVETCLYEQDDDGGARYFFENGLCIVQYPFGQAKIYFTKKQGTIMIGPSGTADFIDGNTTIFSSNSYFHAKKENVKIIASDNVVEDSMLARRNSSSF